MRRVYDAPSVDARHVRTAMTGFFYGPAVETATDEEGKTWYSVWNSRLPDPMGGGTPGNDYYDIDGVTHTMYFDGETSLRDAYWHDDFRRPKSRGCVNLPPRAAKWLSFWAKAAPSDLWVWSHYSTHADFRQ